MITGFLLQVLYAFFTFFIGLLPVIDIPSNVEQAFTTVFAYLNMFSFIVPVGTLLTVLGIVLAYYVAILLLDISLWLIHLVRGR